MSEHDFAYWVSATFTALLAIKAIDTDKKSTRAICIASVILIAYFAGGLFGAKP